MKKAVIIVASIGTALLCVLFIAMRIPKASSLRLGDIDAVLTPYHSTHRWNLSQIRPYLENASWRPGPVMWKEKWDFILADGRALTIDDLTGCFTVEGVAGHFLIRKEDRQAFRTAFMQSQVIETKTSNQPAEATRAAGPRG